MSLFELAEYDFLDGSPFGMGDLGVKLTAAERKAEATKKKAAHDIVVAQNKAAAAAKRQDHAAVVQHQKEERSAKAAAHQADLQKKKEQADALQEARESAKQDKNLSKIKGDITKQKIKNDDLKRQLNAAAAKLAAMKAKPALRGLFGCCPGLFNLGDCVAPMVDDGTGGCIDPGAASSSSGAAGGTSVPSNIQLPPFEPPAAPKGCEGGAHPKRKDCATYTAVVEAFKQWYELLKTQLQYEAQIADLNNQIAALTAQLQAGGYGCTPGQIDPRTGQLCNPNQYPQQFGQGCPAGFSPEPTTGQCTPITMGPTDAGMPSQYGIPGGGGGQFVPEQTLGPGGDAGGGGDVGDTGLPSDFVPFTGGAMMQQQQAQLPYQAPQYAEPFAEQASSGQYAPPEIAVEIVPDTSVRQQRTAPEDVAQGQEPVVYDGDEEVAAVSDFMEESDGMSGLTNLSHHRHDMVEKYFGLAEGPGTAPTDIYGKVVTGIDKAKEIYETLTGKAKPVPTPTPIREEFPWAQILLVGGIGLLGYAFYKKSQVRGRR